MIKYTVPKKEKCFQSFGRFKSTLKATKNRKGLLPHTSGQLDIVLPTLLITLVMPSNFFSVEAMFVELIHCVNSDYYIYGSYDLVQV